jgi:MFS family permease
LFLLTALCSPKFYHEFGWSRGTIGAAVSINLALYGLTAPFAAALMDRFGIRRVVAVALTVIAAGSLLTVWMTAAWQLLLCWGLLVGLGSGSMALAFAATVTDRWFTARRGLVSGILTAASASGQLIFLPLLSWMVTRYDWRPAAVTVALAALAVVPFVPRSPPQHRPETAAPPRRCGAAPPWGRRAGRLPGLVRGPRFSRARALPGAVVVAVVVAWAVRGRG